MVYLSVPDSVAPKQMSLALAHLLHLPVKDGAYTKDDIDDLVLKAIRRCSVRLP